jgi:CheY-like chemotaxis protein
MNKKGPVVLVEDDEDDSFLFEEAYSKLDLPNELVIVTDASKAFEYLSRPEVAPFVIISDINLPGASGLELRNRLFDDPALRQKSIPFVFLTTSDDRQIVKEAYKLPIQGIFSKPNNTTEYTKRIKTMLNYWETSMLL